MRVAILGSVLGAALVAACAVSLDGYTGGPASTLPDGGFDAGGDGGGARTGDAATASDPPMLVTATTTGVTHIRRWDAGAASWGPSTEGPTVANGDPIRGVTVRRSAVNGHRTLAIYTIATSTKGGSLFVYDWDGSKFVPSFTSTDFGATAGWAPFDLAFDGKTGHGLVVYGGGADGNLRFRTFDGTKWSTEAAAFPKPPNTEPYQFVELVTRPGTDDIALAWTDQGSNFAAVHWLGDHFGVPNYLLDKLANETQKTFDGAFETTRGDFLLTWANATTVLYSVSKAGSATIADKTGDLDFAATGRVVLAADPASDRVALVTLEQGCGMEGCDDFTGSVWSGEGWDAAADGTLDGDITTSYEDLEADAPATVTWAPGSQAVGMYHRDSNGFRWGNWNAGTWKLQADYLPQTTIGAKASFVPFHIDGKLYTLVEDRRGVLWSVAYDGAAWHDDDANAPVADDLPSPTDSNGITFSTDSP